MHFTATHLLKPATMIWPRANAMRQWLIGLLGWCALSAFAAPHQHEPPVVLAPGYEDHQFEPPSAGSYQLPSMGDAADGLILNTSGNAGRLHDYLGDKATVLSFIFTTCNDVNGCPLATYVMSGVQKAVLKDPDLVDQVRIVSFSFDPEKDTPSVLGRYGDQFRAEGFDWEFLTTASEDALRPTLDAYDQWVIRDYDEEGNYLGTMSHILRVYLIDSDRRIRNIYSTSYLHADTVVNDLRTLLMQ